MPSFPGTPGAQLLAPGTEEFVMATDRQKEAARENIGKARQAQSARAHGQKVPKRFDVEVSESSWRDLAKGGNDRKR